MSPAGTSDPHSARERGREGTTVRKERRYGQERYTLAAEQRCAPTGSRTEVAARAVHAETEKHADDGRDSSVAGTPTARHRTSGTPGGERAPFPRGLLRTTTRASAALRAGSRVRSDYRGRTGVRITRSGRWLEHRAATASGGASSATVASGGGGTVAAPIVTDSMFHVEHDHLVRTREGIHERRRVRTTWLCSRVSGSVAAL